MYNNFYSFGNYASVVGATVHVSAHAEIRVCQVCRLVTGRWMASVAQRGVEARSDHGNAYRVCCACCIPDGDRLASVLYPSNVISEMPLTICKFVKVQKTSKIPITTQYVLWPDQVRHPAAIVYMTMCPLLTF
jgi:hypothetical protein